MLTCVRFLLVTALACSLTAGCAAPDDPIQGAAEALALRAEAASALSGTMDYARTVMNDRPLGADVPHPSRKLETLALSTGTYEVYAVLAPSVPLDATRATPSAFLFVHNDGWKVTVGNTDGSAALTGVSNQSGSHAQRLADLGHALAGSSDIKPATVAGKAAADFLRGRFKGTLADLAEAIAKEDAAKAATTENARATLGALVDPSTEKLAATDGTILATPPRGHVEPDEVPLPAAPTRGWVTGNEVPELIAKLPGRKVLMKLTSTDGYEYKKGLEAWTKKFARGVGTLLSGSSDVPDLPRQSINGPTVLVSLQAATRTELPQFFDYGVAVSSGDLKTIRPDEFAFPLFLPSLSVDSVVDMLIQGSEFRISVGYMKMPKATFKDEALRYLKRRNLTYHSSESNRDLIDWLVRRVDVATADDRSWLESGWAQ
jgi:hypothetical protein